MSQKSVKGVDLVNRFFNNDASTEWTTEESAALAVDGTHPEAPAKAKSQKGRPPKAAAEKKKNHNIALYPATYDKIVSYANDNHMSISQVIQIAVDKYFS